MISIFADKSTIILRKMLGRPGNKWVIQDFTKTRDDVFGVGQGRVQKIFYEMERLGYVERERRGAKSKTILTNPERLTKDWLNAYKFENNEVYSFYSPDRNILKKLREHLNKEQRKYAFTLHGAANLYTSFVKTDDIYFYLDAEDIKKDILDIRQKLDLKQLMQGGNVHIIKPYYKHSVFFNIHKIRNYAVVSNLQLYLDLYYYQPRGREHAEYLRKILEEKGKLLA